MVQQKYKPGIPIIVQDILNKNTCNKYKLNNQNELSFNKTAHFDLRCFLFYILINILISSYLSEAVTTSC